MSNPSMNMSSQFPSPPTSEETCTDWENLLYLIVLGVCSILILLRALYGSLLTEWMTGGTTPPLTQMGGPLRMLQHNILSLGKKNENNSKNSVMFGYLLRKGTTFWRRRYFVLDEIGQLSYYTNHEEADRGRQPKNAPIQVEKAVKWTQKKENGMKISLSNGHCIIVASEQFHEGELWMNALNQQNEKCGQAAQGAYHFFVSGLSSPLQEKPVMHTLDIQVLKFVGVTTKSSSLSSEGPSSSSGSAPKSNSVSSNLRRMKQYYVVIKFKSDWHDFSSIPVGQTNSQKGSLYSGMEWDNENFTWGFQDHETDGCGECQAAAAATESQDRIESDKGSIFYRGFPNHFSCQLWEASMLRNKKIASVGISLTDLFGLPNMETSNLTCSWPLYEAETLLGNLKLSLAYVATRATGKQPFLTSAGDELEPNGTPDIMIKRVTTISEFFDSFLKDGLTVRDKYYEARGDTGVTTGPWGESNQFGGQVRTVTFTSLTHSPIGPAATSCTSTEHVVIDEEKKTLRYSRKNILHDIPYGDCFSVEQLMIASELNAVVTVSNFLAVPFSKGCMWKSKILSQTASGVAESNDLLFKMFNEASGGDTNSGKAANRMLRATAFMDGTVALEEIFENQRLSIIGGWGAGHLLITDRKRFTNRLGDIEMDFSQVKLPEHWEWTVGWEIDHHYTECDAEGWSYATDFPRFKSHLLKGRSSSRKLGNSVRRRRWVRSMCRV